MRKKGLYYLHILVLTLYPIIVNTKTKYSHYISDGENKIKLYNSSPKINLIFTTKVTLLTKFTQSKIFIFCKILYFQFKISA